MEGLVESAIAKAFGRKLAAVRQANMFTGDIGATALLAKSDALETAKMSLFHPFAFMLAQPEEDPAEIVAALGAGAIADDKYDGIRAQIHTDGAEVRIYSRTLDNVTHRFPEIETAARALGRSVILDGEIVAFSDRILPFAIIQKRLGRRDRSARSCCAEAPVVFFAFDLLYLDGEPLFEMPLRERLDDGCARARSAARSGADPRSATRLADPRRRARRRALRRRARPRERRAGGQGSGVDLHARPPRQVVAEVQEGAGHARLRRHVRAVGQRQAAARCCPTSRSPSAATASS